MDVQNAKTAKIEIVNLRLGATHLFWNSSPQISPKARGSHISLSRVESGQGDSWYFHVHGTIKVQ